ncbi:sialidase family protein [Adhaeretor mobilis]|uniref:exo-alpha-sialidase n=1 Tax=Adhaeretor mobilis TaxID=1930276 RepID=A0A517MVA8_9BACT|nr:sialidase family protein [Adhaeretor mobilis]QDS98806.1 Sialidase precursor [Adhaeretor mobilis]
MILRNRKRFRPSPFLVCFALLATCFLARPVYGQLLREVTVFESGEDGYHTYRVPAILRAADGALLAFCEGRKNSAADTGNIDVVLKRSTDGGQTWGPLIIATDFGPHTSGNPSPIVDRSTGRVVMLTNQNLAEDGQGKIQAGLAESTRTAWVNYSDDHGKSWTNPVEITAQVKRPDWRWLAFGPAHGIQLTRGEHRGRLLVGAVQNGPSSNGAFAVFSDDGGESWQRGDGVESAKNMRPSESVAVELVDGSIQLNSRNRGGHERQRVIAYSRDDGATFPDTGLAAELIDPRVQGSVLRVAAVDEGDDHNEILFSNPAHTNARRKLTVRSSFDETKTWNKGKLIHRGPSAYSDLVELNDGAAGLLYEHGCQNRYERIRFASWPAGWLDDPTQVQFDFAQPPEQGAIQSTRGRPLSAKVEGYLKRTTSDAVGTDGMAWQFNAPGEFVRLCDEEYQIFDFENEDSFTLEITFRTSKKRSKKQGALISKDKGPNSPSYWLRLEGGQAKFLVSDGESVVSILGGKQLNDGKWHHVAAVRDTANWQLRLYVDDRLAARQDDVTHDDLSNDSDLLIGAFNHGRDKQFYGEIDFVRICSAAVNPE